MLRWLLDLFSTSSAVRQLSFSTPITMTGYTLITLCRLDITDHGVFGHLEMDGFECVTLERHDVDIPTGTYKVTLYDSPEHGRVPLLHDVINRTMIEIHEGNFEHNSKGCILVGQSRQDIDKDGFDDITNSKATLKQMLDKWPLGEVEIRII